MTISLYSELSYHVMIRGNEHRTIFQGGIDRKTSSDAASKKSLSEASEEDVSELTLVTSCKAECSDGPYDAKYIVRQ